MKRSDSQPFRAPPVPASLTPSYIQAPMNVARRAELDSAYASFLPLPPNPAPVHLSSLPPFRPPALPPSSGLPVVFPLLPLPPPSLPSFLPSSPSCRNHIVSKCTRINTYSPEGRAFFGGGASGPSATPGDQRSLSETALVQRSGAVEARSFNPRNTSSNNSRRRPRGTPS